jgi:YceI-like domain
MTAPNGPIPLGPGSGRLLIHTRRAGFAQKAGHDLTIEITKWEAEVTVPGGDPGDLAAVGGATVKARLELDSLEVREGTGGALPLTDADRRQIKEAVLRILGSGGAATATFESTRVIAAGQSTGAVEGNATLHGLTRPVRLQVNRLGPDRVRGTATVRQSDFRIKPYSAFFGALKLRDEVLVELEVTVPPA